MRRDMDLIRIILLKIEEVYVPNAQPLFNIKIDGYDFDTIVEHCRLAEEADLITGFKPIYGGGKIVVFSVGRLTNYGYDYLVKIRNDEVWNNTKEIMNANNIPFEINAINKVSDNIINININNLNYDAKIHNDNSVEFGNNNKIKNSIVGENNGKK